MKMKLCLIGCVIWLSASSAQDEVPKEAARAKDREAAMRQWLETERKRGEKAAEKEAQIAALKTDLALPWTSLVIALRYDCSCTGTSYTGFRISRDANAVSVAPWVEWVGRERTGESRQLAKADLDKLLSETALFYLAATLSEALFEKVGQPPADPSKQAEWRQRYLAAGGSPHASDHLWIDVRVATPDGVKRHSNMWEEQAPNDFRTWITAFGTLPLR